jgi:hypothetical protein
METNPQDYGHAGEDMDFDWKEVGWVSFWNGLFFKDQLESSKIQVKFYVRQQEIALFHLQKD